MAYTLLGVEGNLNLGVCTDFGRGVGYYIEHNVVTAMFAFGKTIIDRVIATAGLGKILQTYKWYSELFYEIDSTNLNTALEILDEGIADRESESIPHPYHEVRCECD